MNNPMQILQQVQNLKRQMGNIDPNQYIQQMMNSGKITQAQYDAAVKQAEQLKGFIRK
jgi:predicted RNA-binding protein associated with RNAse of E/G family